MTYIKWGLRLTALTLLLGWLHYTLPERDVVRIVSTETQRIQVGENPWFWSGAGMPVSAEGNRDVRFIEAITPDGTPRVFRNEDTGWGWPPYFKFDSANLQALARDAVSTEAEPEWIAVRHYGWRLQWFTIFPNALSIETVEGPDVSLVPWFTIFFLIFAVVLVLTLYRLFILAWQRRMGSRSR